MRRSGKWLTNSLGIQQLYNFREFKMFGTNLLWQGFMDICRKKY